MQFSSYKAKRAGHFLIRSGSGLRVRPHFSVHFLVECLLIEFHEVGIHREAIVGRSIEDETFTQLIAQGLGKALLGVLHNGFTFLS